jgi:hypothetical protein
MLAFIAIVLRSVSKHINAFSLITSLSNFSSAENESLERDVFDTSLFGFFRGDIRVIALGVMFASVIRLQRSQTGQERRSSSSSSSSERSGRRPCSATFEASKPLWSSAVSSCTVNNLFIKCFDMSRSSISTLDLRLGLLEDCRW